MNGGQLQSKTRLPPLPPPPPPPPPHPNEYIIDLTRGTPEILDQSPRDSHFEARASSSIGDFPEEPGSELVDHGWISAEEEEENMIVDDGVNSEDIEMDGIEDEQDLIDEQEVMQNSAGVVVVEPAVPVEPAVTVEPAVADVNSHHPAEAGGTINRRQKNIHPSGPAGHQNRLAGISQHVRLMPRSATGYNPFNPAVSFSFLYDLLESKFP